MPTTRKQKKARKPRETDMASDIENIDTMLGGNHFEWDECKFSVSFRRPESSSYNTLVNMNPILTLILERTESRKRENETNLGFALIQDELNLVVNSKGYQEN